MRRDALVTCMLLATTSMVVAEPRRAARLHAVAAGVAVLADRAGPVPYVTAQGVMDLDARCSVGGDAAFFTSGDRLFGPRLLVRAGARAYLRDGLWNPYVSVVGAVYHEFDVDYDYSDASQQASTALGAGVALGHELVTAGELTWVLEAAALQLENVQEPWYGAGGFAFHAGTMLGVRF